MCVRRGERTAEQGDNGDPDRDVPIGSFCWRTDRSQTETERAIAAVQRSN
jgi:hypothetical protein